MSWDVRTREVELLVAYCGTCGVDVGVPTASLQEAEKEADAHRQSHEKEWERYNYLMEFPSSGRHAACKRCGHNETVHHMSVGFGPDWHPYEPSIPL